MRKGYLTYENDGGYTVVYFNYKDTKTELGLYAPYNRIVKKKPTGFVCLSDKDGVITKDAITVFWRSVRMYHEEIRDEAEFDRIRITRSFKSIATGGL